MVIASLATNKVIKHMNIDQKSISHQLLVNFKASTVIHVRRMVIHHKILDLRKIT